MTIFHQVRRWPSVVRTAVVLIEVTAMLTQSLAAGPDWWTQRGVIVQGVAPNEYAAINQGQLKNLASAAVLEMDVKLSGGAGDILHSLVSGWRHSNPHDYDPVNLGQLKNLAKPFYDRLITEGVIVGYPWNSGSTPQDYALVNIGQAKNLFAFTLIQSGNGTINGSGGAETGWQLVINGNTLPYNVGLGHAHGATPTNPTASVPLTLGYGKNKSFTEEKSENPPDLPSPYVEVKYDGDSLYSNIEYWADQPMPQPMLTHPSPMSWEALGYTPTSFVNAQGQSDPVPGYPPYDDLYYQYDWSYYIQPAPKWEANWVDQVDPNDSTGIPIPVDMGEWKTQPLDYSHGGSGLSVSLSSPPTLDDLLPVAKNEFLKDKPTDDWLWFTFTPDKIISGVHHDGSEAQPGRIWSAHATGTVRATYPNPNYKALRNTPVYFEIRYSPASESDKTYYPFKKVKLIIKKGESASEPWFIVPSAGEEIEVRSIEQDDPTPPPPPPYTITGSDSTGPRYRKVGLNGVPLADGKPQHKDESGESPEETYIDAFTRELRHSVSDVYVSLESSLMPLMVRRDVVSEAWNGRSGLAPSERPDRPFGAGWTSNLCASIRIEKEGRRAVVTDEQGATEVFAYNRKTTSWIHTREERSDQKTQWNQLKAVKDGDAWIYVLKKRYGTTCTYHLAPLTQSFPSNREDEQGDMVHYIYYRLDSVTDRLGNRLNYTYSTASPLIPSAITDPNRPGHSISIQQEGGVVTAVRGPSGDTTSYGYQTLTDAAADKERVLLLTSVTKDNASVSYDYVSQLEEDIDGILPPSPTWQHVALSQITDERNGQYKFDLELNRGVKYDEVDGADITERQQLGLPLQITRVQSPTSIFRITGYHEFRHLGGPEQSFSAATTVSSSAVDYQYSFGNPSVYIPIEHDEDDPADKDRSLHLSIGFTNLVIVMPYVRGASGNTIFPYESYEFDPNYGMALSSATDINGNTTTFEYDGSGSYLITGFDDPVSQTTDAGTKTYTYDAETRVMSSVTDERGVSTVYDIEGGTGLRTKETISGPGGGGRITDFTYGSGGFAGFLAQKKVHSSGQQGQEMPETITTYVPDSQGRVASETTTAANSPLTTAYFYDLNGSKTGVTDANGNSTLFQYDQHHRLRYVTHPDGSQKRMCYDLHGNLVKEVNEIGTATEHTYDALNRRTQSTTTVAPGKVISHSFEYNSMNLPTKETDPRGKVTLHNYDGLGRRILTDDGGFTTKYAYGANSGGGLFDTASFKPTKITEPSGKVTDITYDANYRPITQTTTDAGTTSTEYDETGHPVKVTDALGHVMVMDYDALGQAVKVTHPDGTTQQNFYTHSGQVWKTVDALQRTTTTTYDAAGRAIQITNAANVSVFKTYDANGNALTVSDPRDPSRHTTTEYDNRNRPIHVTLPAVGAGTAQTYTKYDALGNALCVWDPLGFATQKEYDAVGRVTKITDALNQITSTTYDANSNVLSVTNARNVTTQNTYDSHNRLTRSVDPASIANNFEYDEAGNRTVVKDGMGNTTRLTYDKVNRVLTETHPGGDVTTTTYNALYKIDRRDSLGNTHLDYDSMGRVLKMTSTEGLRNYSYDDGGQLLEVTESNRAEARVAYTYDLLGRIQTETSRGLLHTYGYDDAGNRTHAAYGTGRSVETTFDALNRPSTITEGGHVTTYHYDLAGRAVQQDSGNGQCSENTYDPLGRLQQRVLYTNATKTTAIAAFHWSHDAMGNVTHAAELWPGGLARGNGWRTTEMIYDNDERLQQETVTDPPSLGGVASNPKVTVYGYDAAHNRTTKVEAGGTPAVTKSLTYFFNSDNQLTKWVESSNTAPERTTSLAYDHNGNRTSQTISTTGTAGDHTTNYAWDSLNRLKQVTLPDGSTHQYGYDYRTRRISVQDGSVTQAIVFSGGLSLAEYGVATAAQGISNPGTPSVQYQRGPDMGGGVGGLLYSVRGSVTKFNLSNGRGDIVAQSNSSGALTWTASYEAFGKRPKETGVNLDKQRGNSKDEDPTGLLNEGFRYRDLESGVWLSRDPAGFVDGPNLYAYVQQNPWTKFDPEGLYWFVENFSDIPAFFMPHPIDSYHEAAAQRDIATDSTQPTLNRIGGAFGCLGNGMSVVLDCVPGEVGLKKAVVGGMKKFLRTEGEHVAEQVIKNIGKEEVEGGVKKIAQNTEKQVEKEVAKEVEKTHVTYTKEHPETGEIYSGRSSGPSTMSPEEIVAKRDAGHHMNDKGFGPAKLDESSTNKSAIRGREQQLIEANGGAKSSGGTSGNAINGVAPNNPNKKDLYLDQAKKEFGG